MALRGRTAGGSPGAVWELNIAGEVFEAWVGVCRWYRSCGWDGWTGAALGREWIMVT